MEEEKNNAVGVTKSEVGREMEELFAVLSQTRELMGIIMKRIDPVMRDEDPQEQKKTTDPKSPTAQSGIGRAFRDAREIAEMTVADLSGILKRLSL